MTKTKLKLGVLTMLNGLEAIDDASYGEQCLDALKEAAASAETPYEREVAQVFLETSKLIDKGYSEYVVTEITKSRIRRINRKYHIFNEF